MSSVALLAVFFFSCASAKDGSTSDFEAALSRANASLNAGNLVDALLDTQKAIAADPNRFEGHYFAAVIFLRQGLLGDAEKEAELAEQKVSKKFQDDLDALKAKIVFRQILVPAKYLVGQCYAGKPKSASALSLCVCIQGIDADEGQMSYSLRIKGVANDPKTSQPVQHDTRGTFVSDVDIVQWQDEFSKSWFPVLSLRSEDVRTSVIDGNARVGDVGYPDGSEIDGFGFGVRALNGQKGGATRFTWRVLPTSKTVSWGGNMDGGPKFTLQPSSKGCGLN